MGPLIAERAIATSNIGHGAQVQLVLGVVFDQIDQRFVGEAIFVGPARIAKNPKERFGVGLFDTPKCLFDSNSHIGRFFPDIIPVAPSGDFKPVKLR